MSLEKEIVTAVIIILSKNESMKRKGLEISPAVVKNLNDMERALDILRSLCEGDEVNYAEKWFERIRDLRGQVEEVMDLYRKSAGEYPDEIERDMFRLLDGRLPDPGYREVLKQELSKVEIEDRDDTGLISSPSASRARDSEISSLEQKLRMIKAEVDYSGLEKFLAEEEED